MKSNETKYGYLPYNGERGQPCIYGCIMKRDLETGKLLLDGDCRCPGSKECAMNIQYKGSVA